MVWVVAGLMTLMGVGIAAIWTMDIVAGEKVDLSNGVAKARDVDGSLFLPHWIAEYTTAALLLTGGVALAVDADWAHAVAALAAGALFYTSVNSLGWALAEPERRAYAVPMAAGVLVSLVAAIWLLAA